MSSTLSQPEAQEVGEFLTGLLGLETTLKAGGSLGPAKIASVTTYVDDETNVRAVIACDIEGAAKLAAALTRVPVGGAEDAIENGSLSSQLADNLAEVFNIGVNVFREAESSRISMEKTWHGDDAVSNFEKLASTGNSSTYELSIQNYGGGCISITTL